VGPEIEALEDPRLAHFVELIQRYGARINLVGNLDGEFIKSDLIKSSLALLALARPEGRLVDVGSGAGLPGIPLAMALPKLDVTLVEIREKRGAFLRVAVRELALDNVRVVTGDATQLTESFDWAVARAFRPPAEWLRIARSLIASDGHIGLYTTTDAWSALSVSDRDGTVKTAPDETGPDRIVVHLRPWFVALAGNP
jgi:16S rRNA (guanine527-N7)-methyltransferase